MTFTPTKKWHPNAFESEDLVDPLEAEKTLVLKLHSNHSEHLYSTLRPEHVH